MEPVTEGDQHQGNTEQHGEAREFQKRIKQWLEREDLLTEVETGIRFKDGKVTLHIPDGIREDVTRRLPEEFKDKVIVLGLRRGNRKRLCGFRPGRAGLYPGDGTACTLGAYVRDTAGKLYGTTSSHGAAQIGQEIWADGGGGCIGLHPTPPPLRFGTVVAQVDARQPVVDACLVSVNDNVVDRCHLGTFWNNPEPAMYMQLSSSIEGGPAAGQQPMHVLKMGKGTGLTEGDVVEYSRDLLLADGQRLEDNIVIRGRAPHAEEGAIFAGEGDSGAVVLKATRMITMREGKIAHYYGALSMLYMMDSETGECFSFPLSRALELLGQQLGTQLTLAD